MNAMVPMHDLLAPPFGPLNGLHGRLLQAKPMDLSALVLFLVAMAPMAPMAYFLVLPGTRSIRAVLGAHGLGLLTHTWMSYRFQDPAWAFLNAATTLFYLYSVIKYVEWMCLSTPVVDPRLSPSSPLSARLLSAIDLCINTRYVGLSSVGLDTTLGPPNHTITAQWISPAFPRPWPAASRARSVVRHVWAAAWRYGIVDIIAAFQRSMGADSLAKPGGRVDAIGAFVRQWSGVDGLRHGAATGDLDFGVALRSTAAWLFAMLVIPVCAALLIATVYHALAAVAVATVWEPSSWDTPLFDSFFLADSLNDLWGRRWHQIIRHPMVVLSASTTHLLPRRLRGRTTQFILVFTYSALFHVLAHLAMDPVPSSAKVGGFFILSGLGCAAERLFRRATGRRVRGLAGWVWTWAFMFAKGRMCAEAWMDAGFAVAWTRMPRWAGDVVVRWAGWEAV